MANGNATIIVGSARQMCIRDSARSMRSKGLISAKEYAKIDTIIAEKYGISSCSIFR